jgi:hypothetical protein
MSIPRVPRDRDPRRPPQRDGEANDNTPKKAARSYGQLAPTPELLDDFEEVTGEVAREGDEPAESADAQTARRERAELRKIEEFEDLTEEPVREEGPR